MIKMNKLFLLLLIGLIPSANAGVYYYPNYSLKDGVKTLDFISAEYAESQGKILKKKEKEANFRVFNMK